MRTALQAAGRATAAATRDPNMALGDIASQVRSIAIDVVKASEASEAGETDRGALTDARTEELLATPSPSPTRYALTPRAEPARSQSGRGAAWLASTTPRWPVGDAARRHGR